MLSAYEAICSLAIGFAGAYIALPEFRYQTAIRKFAKKTLRNNEATITETQKTRPAYRLTKSFAEIQIGKQNTFDATVSQLRTPSIKKFCKYFGLLNDRKVVMLAGLVAFGVIVASTIMKLYFPGVSWAGLEVAWNGESVTTSDGQLKESTAGAWKTGLLKAFILLICFFTLFVPISTIINGRKCRDDLKDYIEEELSKEREPDGEEMASVDAETTTDAKQVAKYLEDHGIPVSSALTELVTRQNKTS